MLSDDKIATFLSLHQSILSAEDETKLLEQVLPQVLNKLSAIGFAYEFVSAVFIDPNHKIEQTFFADKQSQTISAEGIINFENLLQKGSSWEMELFYGKPAIVSDAGSLVNIAYANFSSIHSLLIFPITTSHKLSGMFILASLSKQEVIDPDESQFIQMIAYLLDSAYRLQDTENSLTKITKQVYEMNARLHQLDQLKDDFVSVASHELRTPMTAIRSYVWMALHRSDIPLSQKLERYLYRTLLSTERLINLVNDMLNVSRIESGRIEINPKPFDVVLLVKDVVEEVKARGEEKRLQFLVLEHKVPMVFADPDKVHEVLLNLVGNALKFTYPGGTITVDFFTDGQMLEISVKDNGLGVAQDDLNKLFHKFSRLDYSYTSISTSGGTGLGLFISKSLVELMHGRIWAQSEGLDKGATFAFSLPIATKEALEHAEQYQIKVQGEAKNLEPVAI